MANAHSHAFHRALRGRVNGGGGNFWSWREQMYAAARAAQPRHVLRARAGRLRRDGAGRHHRRGGVPLRPPPAGRQAVPRPQRHGSRRAPGGRRGRHPAHAARHVLPRGRPQRRRPRRAAPGPAALQRRHRRGVGRAHVATRHRETDRVRLGAAIHSVRAVAREDLPKVVEAAGSCRCTSTSPSSTARTSRARCSTAHARPSCSTRPGRSGAT